MLCRPCSGSTEGLTGHCAGRPRHVLSNVHRRYCLVVRKASISLLSYRCQPAHIDASRTIASGCFGHARGHVVSLAMNNKSSFFQAPYLAHAQEAMALHGMGHTVSSCSILLRTCTPTANRSLQWTMAHARLCTHATARRATPTRASPFSTTGRRGAARMWCCCLAFLSLNMQPAYVYAPPGSLRHHQLVTGWIFGTLDL